MLPRRTRRADVPARRLPLPAVWGLLLILLPALAPAAFAGTTYNVSTVAQLDAAVAAAGSGDVIQIAAGVYALDQTLQPNSGVTINGAGAAGTILDALGTRRILSVSSGSLALSGLTLRNGSVAGGATGGGLSNGLGTVTVTGCAFISNSAAAGGGLYNFGGTVTLTNCTFAGNSAIAGGGLYNFNGTVTLTGCTFNGNSASNTISPSVSSGGGLDSENGLVTLTDDILWGDAAPNGPEIYLGGGTLSTSYSDIQGNPGTPTSPDSNHNFGADPLFVRPYSPATGADLRVRTGSPVVGAGTTSAPAYLPYDITGAARDPGHPTLGAYEVPASVGTALRINSGGGAYTDSHGNVWAADTPLPGSATWSFGALVISGTPDPELYRDVRWSTASFTYHLTAAPGAYTLNLYFVEGDYHAAPGYRLFNVLVNGATAVPNLDVYTRAGGLGRPLVVPLSVTVPSSGALDVTFQTVRYGAMVSAVELVPAT